VYVVSYIMTGRHLLRSFQFGVYLIISLFSQLSVHTTDDNKHSKTIVAVLYRRTALYPHTLTTD